MDIRYAARLTVCVVLALSCAAHTAAADCPANWKTVDPASNGISVNTEAGNPTYLLSCTRSTGEASMHILGLHHRPAGGAASRVEYVAFVLAQILSSGVRWSDDSGTLEHAVTEWGFPGFSPKETGSIPSIHGDLEYMIFSHDGDNRGFVRNGRTHSGSHKSAIKGSVCFSSDFAVTQDTIRQFANAIGIRHRASATETFSPE